jgi:hypothetical protein
MADDFYIQSAARRASMIEAELAAAKADLAAYKANHDVDSASQSVQSIANLEAERANLVNLYNAYVQSQRPPQPEELSDAERMSKPWNKMTPDDGLALARTSRYAKDLSWDDPSVKAGWAEMQRRRSRGE